jgi:hypothetical protein
MKKAQTAPSPTLLPLVAAGLIASALSPEGLALAALSSASSPTSAASGTAAGSSSAVASEALKKISNEPTGIAKYLGVTYFTFFDGPGLGTEFSKTPNNLGKPADKGWSFWTNLSARVKFSQRLAFDAQFRLQQIVTNKFEFRYQGVRFGLSGTLLKIETPTYKLTWTGAVNSDVPFTGGQVLTERTLIANPGMFSSMTLRPNGSKLSMYALIGPRFFIYSDPNAMDQQSLAGGAVPGQKPQIAFSVNPSLNYDLAENTAVRAGVTVDVRKNMNDAALRRWFWPVDMGISHSFNQYLSIYPHVRFSGPWDDKLRAELKAPTGTEWYDTASVGLWLNGTLF